MIRKMLGLALEAAKEEIRIWKNPAPMLPEPLAETPVEEIRSVPVESNAYQSPPVSSWRGNSQRMHEALGSTKCPDCEAPKEAGWFQCAACRTKKAAS